MSRITCLTACALAFCCMLLWVPSASAQQTSAAGILQPVAGSTVVVKMIDAVDSSSDPAGKQYRATVTEPVNAGNNVIIGQGSVATVTLARNGSGWVAQLTSLVINGQSVAVTSDSALVTSAAQNAVGDAANALRSVLGGFGRGANPPSGVAAIATGARVILPPGTSLSFVLGANPPPNAATPAASSAPVPSAADTAPVAPAAQPPAAAAARQGGPAQAQNQPVSPPAPPVMQYLFCTGVASPQSTIYYSGTIVTTEKNTNPVHVAFFQFLKQQYSYKGLGEYPGDLQCTGVRSVEEARSVEQLYVNRDRQNKRNVIETGWTYNGAPAPVVSSAPAATPVNATGITGVYDGNYRCARGPVNLTLTLVAPGDGSLTGVFTFDLPANSRTRTASYTLSGTYDAATGGFRLVPVKWEPPAPPGFVMVGMDGAFNSSAEQVSGKITYATCTTFEATRNKAQSAALSSRPAIKPAAPAAQPPAVAAARQGGPAQAQAQKGRWWFCSARDDNGKKNYVSGVFFYPDDGMTPETEPVIIAAWLAHLYKTLPNSRTFAVGCTLGGADQALTQRFHDAFTTAKGFDQIAVDWKYVPGQDLSLPAPVASGKGKPSYCSGRHGGKGGNLYFSDIFEIPPHTPLYPVINDFAQFVIAKYGEGVVGVTCPSSDNMDPEKQYERERLGYKIIDTGWKPKSLPPPNLGN